MLTATLKCGPCAETYGLYLFSRTSLTAFGLVVCLRSIAFRVLSILWQCAQVETYGFFSSHFIFLHPFSSYQQIFHETLLRPLFYRFLCRQRKVGFFSV